MSYRILIVDDSPIIRSVTRKIIGMCGLDVAGLYEAQNGVEALKILGEEWIDVVFADINMPEMNGIELVEKMIADDMLKSIPVVIVSTERSEVRIAALKAMGVRAYIKKPFRPEEFQAAVEDVLGVVGAGGGR